MMSRTNSRLRNLTHICLFLILAVVPATKVQATCFKCNVFEQFTTRIEDNGNTTLKKKKPPRQEFDRKLDAYYNAVYLLGDLATGRDKSLTLEEASALIKLQLVLLNFEMSYFHGYGDAAAQFSGIYMNNPKVIKAVISTFSGNDKNILEKARKFGAKSMKIKIGNS